MLLLKLHMLRRPGNLHVSFEVKTCVWQGCVMSSVLFNTAIDWVLRRTVEDQRRGIRWTPRFTLEDLDFADDLALLSHTWQHVQEKTERLSIFSNQVGLTISLKKKTEAMCVNVPSPTGHPIHRQVHIPWKCALRGWWHWCGHTKQAE